MQAKELYNKYLHLIIKQMLTQDKIPKQIKQVREWLRNKKLPNNNR
ncbi:MAG: hypothetical protein GF332_00990 [Candidatus Moranbacteria bacterium]|nr:hypothetical protein [Candidatus Moranbacteria bacterium]